MLQNGNNHVFAGNGRRDRTDDIEHDLRSGETSDNGALFGTKNRMYIAISLFHVRVLDIGLFLMTVWAIGMAIHLHGRFGACLQAKGTAGILKESPWTITVGVYIAEMIPNLLLQLRGKQNPLRIIVRIHLVHS